MGKTTKKGKKDRHVVDDEPVASVDTGRSFPCPRCQASLTSAAQLPDHQLDAHLLKGLL